MLDCDNLERATPRQDSHIVTIPPLPLSLVALTSSTAVRRSRSKSSMTFTVRRVQAMCSAGGVCRAFTAAQGEERRATRQCGFACVREGRRSRRPLSPGDRREQSQAVSEPKASDRLTVPPQLVHLVPDLIHRHLPLPVPLPLRPTPKRHHTHERVPEHVQLRERRLDPFDQALRRADNVPAQGGVAVEAEVDQRGVRAGDDRARTAFGASAVRRHASTSPVRSRIQERKRTESLPSKASHRRRPASS